MFLLPFGTGRAMPLIGEAYAAGEPCLYRVAYEDPFDLDKRLQRIANEPGNKLVVVEGIYSASQPGASRLRARRDPCRNDYPPNWSAV